MPSTSLNTLTKEWYFFPGYKAGIPQASDPDTTGTSPSAMSFQALSTASLQGTETDQKAIPQPSQKKSLIDKMKSHFKSKK